MKGEKTKVTVSLPAATLRRARAITGRGVTDTIRAGLEALDRQARRSALRALKGRVRFDLDLERTRLRRAIAQEAGRAPEALDEDARMTWLGYAKPPVLLVH